MHAQNFQTKAPWLEILNDVCLFNEAPSSLTVCTELATGSAIVRARCSRFDIHWPFSRFVHSRSECITIIWSIRKLLPHARLSTIGFTAPHWSKSTSNRRKSVKQTSAKKVPTVHLLSRRSDLNSDIAFSQVKLSLLLVIHFVWCIFVHHLTHTLPQQI